MYQVNFFQKKLGPWSEMGMNPQLNIFFNNLYKYKVRKKS